MASAHTPGSGTLWVDRACAAMRQRVAANVYSACAEHVTAAGERLLPWQAVAAIVELGRLIITASALGVPPVSPQQQRKAWCDEACMAGTQLFAAFERVDTRFAPDHARLPVLVRGLAPYPGALLAGFMEERAEHVLDRGGVTVAELWEARDALRQYPNTLQNAVTARAALKRRIEAHIDEAVLAVAMATHPRLGAEAPLRCIGADVLRLVVSQGLVP